jgi:hypothetical protein
MSATTPPTPTPLDKLGTPPERPKRSPASLFGGVACGVGAFILTLLLAGGSSALNIAIALVVGAALGAWVRLADL